MLDGHVIRSARGPGFKPCSCQIILWTLGEISLSHVESNSTIVLSSGGIHWIPVE
jgi:hypothetical protein